MNQRLSPLPLLATMMALAACQGGNPYRAESLPYPPQPKAAANVEFDPSSYPAAPHDYGRYRSWSWAKAGVDDGLLREAVSQQLDRRGLRPARPGSPSDITVSAFQHSELRIRQFIDHYSGYYGNYDGRLNSWYGYGAGYPVIRTYTAPVTVMHIELFDARTHQLVWSNSAESEPGASRSDQANALREAVRQALSNYPPN